MKIKESDTNELLMIANNVTGEYSEKEVRQAKEELYRRGVDDKVIADIMEGGSLHAKAGCCRTCGESPHGQTEREEQECQLPMVGTDTDAFVCPVLSGERRKGTCGYTVVSSGLSTQPDTR